jgi:hypothetical protein
VNGTNTSTSSQGFVLIPLVTTFCGKETFLSGCPSGGSSTTYSLRAQTGATVTSVDYGNGAKVPAQTDAWRIMIIVAAGYTANNLVFKPMLNEGDTALPYEPYFEGLRDTAVSELKSEGANLIPFPYWDGNYDVGSSKTINGVTFTVNADGSITANGTATATANFFLINTPIAGLVEIGKTYTLSGCPSGGGNEKYKLHFRDSSNYGNQWFEDGEGYTRAAVADDGFTYKYQAWIVIFAGYTANNLVFKPMLNEGTTALPYSPYGTIDTFSIPKDIQDTDGYGIGKSETEYNYIDFNKKIFKKEYEKIRISPSIGSYNKSQDWYSATFSSFKINPISYNIVCNILPYTEIYKTTNEGIGVNPNKSSLVMRVTGLTSTEEYRQWL